MPDTGTLSLLSEAGHPKQRVLSNSTQHSHSTVLGRSIKVKALTCRTAEILTLSCIILQSLEEALRLTKVKIEDLIHVPLNLEI